MRGVHGVRILLRRAPEADVSGDWLSLYLDGGPSVQWGLRPGRVYWQGAALESIPVPLHVDLGLEFPWHHGCILNHLESLTRNLVHVRLPARALAQEVLEIEIRFEEAVPVQAQAPSPRALANVLPVWNSLQHRYPEPSDVEQAVSGRRRRHIHLLSTEDLGSAWRAWAIERVGATDESNLRLKGLHSVDASGAGSEDAYSVVLAAPPSASGGSTSPLQTLAVLLSTTARRQFDRLCKRVGVHFLATTGADGNGLPVGTEFQLVDRTELPLEVQASGRLVCGTFGGSNGLAAEFSSHESDDELLAFLPGPVKRTVADVARIVSECYGDEIELVDERDLLRPPGSAQALNGPLEVRVRFHQPSRDPILKRVVLDSCAKYLERYLAVNHGGGIHLVNIQGEGAAA